MNDEKETVYRVMTEIFVEAPTAEAAVDAVVGDIDYLLSCETRLVAYNTLDAREFVDEDEDSTWQEWRDDPVRAAVRYTLEGNPYVFDPNGPVRRFIPPRSKEEWTEWAAELEKFSKQLPSMADLMKEYDDE